VQLNCGGTYKLPVDTGGSFMTYRWSKAILVWVGHQVICRALRLFA